MSASAKVHEKELQDAARTGDICRMHAAKAQGASEYRQAMIMAASSGQAEATRLAWKWICEDMRQASALWRMGPVDCASRGIYGHEYVKKEILDDCVRQAVIGNHRNVIHTVNNLQRGYITSFSMTSACLGHEGCMELAWELGEEMCDMSGAARHGYESCMALIKAKSGSNLAETALSAAAGTGQLGCMRLAIVWGACSHNDALLAAAAGGHPRCMRLAIVSGATNADKALYLAALEGHEDCMRVAVASGAIDHDGALLAAATRNRGDCMLYAIAQGATRYQEALECAALRGHVNCMKIAARGLKPLAECASRVLKMVRKAGYSDARRGECTRLLRKWAL